jgi:predicted transcriptional regulator
MSKPIEGNSVTVWLEPEVKADLDREAGKLGVTRSWVLRHLIRRWLVGRKAGKKELLEAGV